MLPVDSEFRRFVDDQRIRCLWFMRRDYYPATDAERLRALDAIERHGDLEAFKRARSFRAWLLQHSSDTSAV